MAKYNIYGYRDELRERRKRRKARIAFLIISSLVGLILFSIYALIFSSWFLVKEVQVSGQKEVPEEEIRNLISNYLSRRYFFNYISPFSNIILASSESIENSLRSNFPVIEATKVSKSLFKKSLTVQILEREIAGIWCKENSDKCFYFDKDGIFFKSAPKFSGEVFLTIEDSRGRNFNLIDSFDDKELFEKINLTRNILDDLKFIDYVNFFLPKGSFEFWIKTKDGWYIYLDKETDVPNQLVALKKFLEEKLPAARRQSLQYIDLRINNRIYYK